MRGGPVYWLIVGVILIVRGVLTVAVALTVTVRLTVVRFLLLEATKHGDFGVTIEGDAVHGSNHSGPDAGNSSLPKCEDPANNDIGDAGDSCINRCMRSSNSGTAHA